MGGDLQAVDAVRFMRRFRFLIGLTWAIPPFFGLGFLLLVVQLFTLEQLGQLLLVPPLPVYILGTQVLADLGFKRWARPIVRYLEAPTLENATAALARTARFPLHFWGVFVLYLVLAPVSVVWSGAWAYGFQPSPVDWFRLELTALVVSIIVGLPLFLRMVDLFGDAFRDLELTRPQLSVGAKVFLVGALAPLLIDTLLVQYYWTHTGYFTRETFLVWVVLELLAIAGALLVARSLGQGLAPLRATMGQAPLTVDTSLLRPRSTDEHGVVAAAYRRLLEGLKAQSVVLELRNELLRGSAASDTMAEVVAQVLQTAQQATGAQLTLLARTDDDHQELRIVAVGDRPYAPEGHRRLTREPPSVLWRAIDTRQTAQVLDAQADPEAHQELSREFGCRSAVMAPLVADGKLLGVLAAGFEKPKACAEDEARVLEAIATEAAWLFQQVQLRSRQSELELQLRRSQRLESVGLLAGGVAHDFNNILTVIIGSASLLRPGAAAEEVEALKQEILDAAERAGTLTRQLLAFSRRQQVDRKTLDANEVVDGMRRMLQRLVPSNIELQLRLASELLPVDADRGQLEQVLVNLLVNARDALEGRKDGRITVRSFSQRDAAGHWVVLEVQDNGVGMAPGLQERIFEPYFSTKGEGQGTGLGLATAFGIVTQFDGRLTVHSAPGEGATFTVRLPRVDSALSPRAPSAAAAATTGDPLAGHRVLVVEDEEKVRSVLARVLRQEGLEVVLAARGDEALRLIETADQPVHLLITDVVMPGVQGPEVARRALERWPELVVLVTTGYADGPALAELRASRLPMLPKPFDATTLVTRLRTLWSARATATASAPPRR